MFNDLIEGINLNRLSGASSDKVISAFFANYLASLVLLRLQDLKGLMLINDRSHSKLTSFSSDMSDINFWGRALFYSTSKDVSHKLLHGHADVLNKDASRISTPRIHKLLTVPLTNPEQVDWHDTTASLMLMRHRFEVRSSYYDKLIKALHNWTGLNDAGKQRAVNDAFMYLLQSDAESSLLSRLRALSNSTMVNAIDSVAATFAGFKRLHEDGEGGAPAGDAGTGAGSVGSTNNIVSLGSNTQSNPSAPPTPDLGGLYRLIKVSKHQVTKKGRFTIHNGKLVKRRVKSFEPKQFKSPLIRREI